jgi:hypothetical protein
MHLISLLYNLNSTIMKKSILTAAFILAVIFSLSNEAFAQNPLPYFNVTVKQEFCGNLVSGAVVIVYASGTDTELARAQTNSNGVAALGDQLSGNCPFNVDIHVNYNDSQSGQLLNVTRSCSGNNYQICLGAPSL